jgi:hypothetical protein
LVLSGGAAFAASQLAENSVGTRQLKPNAVTAAKIHKNFIDAAKVEDHSLTAADFETSQLPRGPIGPVGPRRESGPQGPAGSGFAVTEITPNEASDPPAKEAETDLATRDGGRFFKFDLPTAGKIFVRFFAPVIGAGCSEGYARAELYLDGVPLSGTGQLIPKNGEETRQYGKSREFTAITQAASGAHVLTLSEDCPSSSSPHPSAWLFSGDNVWTVIALGG